MRSTTANTHREVTRLKIFGVIEDVVWTAMWEDLVNIVTRFDIIKLFGKEVKFVL
jgi:hypothetical protein